MGSRHFVWLPRILGSGLLMSSLIGVGCGGSGGDPKSPGGNSSIGGNSTGLLRARDCDDLLSKIQDDAIAKVRLAVEAAKAQDYGRAGGGGGVVVSPGFPRDDAAEDGASGDPNSGPAPAPTAPGAGAGQDANAGGSGGDGDSGGGPTAGGPTGAS